MSNEYENMIQDLEKDWSVDEPNFHSKKTPDAALDGAASAFAAADIQNQPNNDDWAMNTLVSSEGISNLPDQKNSADKTANAPDTNPLHEETKDQWQMPEPVFRVSSGKKIKKSAAPMPPLASPAKPPETSQTANTTVDIQPQPYISEEFTTGDDAVVEEPTAEVKSKTGRIIFAVAGILAMILFAVGFLIGIYFLFFRQPEL